MFEHKRKYLMELLYNEIERHIVKKSWRYFITTRRGYMLHIESMLGNGRKSFQVTKVGITWTSASPVKREQELHESWWELRRTRELPWEFSQLSCPGHANENKSCMRVDESWEARVCMRVFSLNSRGVPVKLNENKSCMRVDESWEARVCMRVFSTLMRWSNENKSCMRVDESWLDIIARGAKLSSTAHIKI